MSCASACVEKMPWTYPVMKPYWLAAYGYEISPHRRYVQGGVRYNYVLLDGAGAEVVCQPHGYRRLLSYNFPTPWGRRHRIDLHRLVAFNHPQINRAPVRTWRPTVHCHHKPSPCRRGSPPWKNSLWQNLELMTVRQHRDWHIRNPDVPWHPF